jgi:tetratricopeptide (TPR) repeat protein
VAWISERKNLLSGLLYLGAALVYLDFRGLAPRRADLRWGRYAGALALFVGALLSKTVTASLPAAIALIVWWKEGRIGWRDLLPLAPFFALGVVAGLNTAWMERVHVGAVGVDWDFTLLERWLIATRALWFYPAKLLWPASLSFSYPRWDVDPTDPGQYAYGVALVAAFGLLWAGRRRIGRGPLVAALFYAGTLFPALGFVDLYPMRFSFVADHFAYLASLGLIAPAAAGAARAIQAAERAGSSAARAALVVGLVLVLLALGVRTFGQSRIYHDEETLWRDTLAKNPASWLAHNNLGRVLGLRGEHEIAETHFRRAVELERGDHVLETNLAEALVHLGDHRAALEHARIALAVQPDHAAAHFVSWVALRALGALDEAVVHLHRYAAIERSFEAHFEAARHFAAAGRPRDALIEIERARRAGRATAELAVTQGNVLLALDQPRQAVAAFRAAAELRADWVPARLGLARALERAGRPALAARAYARVLELDPDDRAAQRGLRRVRETTAERPRSGDAGRSAAPGGDRSGVGRGD